MTAWFKQPLTTLAFAWAIERRDGVTLGFTSHDRDLIIGGMLHRAAPGMIPSAIERSDSLVPDDVELSGALTSAAFSEDDLIAGRWDGAALTVTAVDWRDPDVDPQILVRGEFGAVELRDGAFKVALRGAAAVFDRPVVEATAPECRAELGDRRCRVDLAGLRTMATVASGGESEIVLEDVPAPDGALSFGTLIWLDGANAGLTGRITGNAGTVVTLEESPPFAAAAGDRCLLTQGCDKRFATCGARFANTENFRGEPHLPGNDVLTRYGD